MPSRSPKTQTVRFKTVANSEQSDMGGRKMLLLFCFFFISEAQGALVLTPQVIFPHCVWMHALLVACLHTNTPTHTLFLVSPWCNQSLNRQRIPVKTFFLLSGHRGNKISLQSNTTSFLKGLAKNTGVLWLKQSTNFDPDVTFVRCVL